MSRADDSENRIEGYDKPMVVHLQLIASGLKG